MKIVSWNVNSIKARKDHALRFLNDRAPDVLMIQELKGLEFPQQDFLDAGYQSVFKAQKAYNGVAIFAKTAPELIHDQLPGMEEDEQARFIEADINGIRMINVYCPNGNPYPGPKFDYKLEWMNALYQRLIQLKEQNIPFLIGGDFNIIPEDIDCYDPKAWQNDALFQPESRAFYRRFTNLGLYDALRIFSSAEQEYTFWDYTGGAFPSNKGIRIDHFFLSPSLADRTTACYVDREPREWERPSDHTSIILELDY